MMSKSMICVVLSCLVAAALAAPFEDREAAEGMKSAFQKGVERFGGAVAKGDTIVPQPRAHGKKTVWLQNNNSVPPALGGGRAPKSEMYRENSYAPLAPVDEPIKHSVVSGKMNAAQTAERMVPHPPVKNIVQPMFIVGEHGRK